MKATLLRDGVEVWAKVFDTPNAAPSETEIVKIVLPNYGAGEYALIEKSLHAAQNFARR